MPTKHMQKTSRILTWIELGLGFLLIALAITKLPTQPSEHLITLAILTIASAFTSPLRQEVAL